MTESISAYFENAQLSMAAYANLLQGMTGAAYLIELKNAGFSDMQAAVFASTYSVVKVFDDPATAFQATLFQKNGTSVPS
jgi:hypothetical protein